MDLILTHSVVSSYSLPLDLIGKLANLWKMGRTRKPGRVYTSLLWYRVFLSLFFSHALFLSLAHSIYLFSHTLCLFLSAYLSPYLPTFIYIFLILSLLLSFLLFITILLLIFCLSVSSALFYG